MIEQARMRVLDWEGCLNVRDLGGYPTNDGRETQWGRVFRADNLGGLSAAGQQSLIDQGVRTIVDLRLPAEVKAHPNPFAGADEMRGVTYVNISLVDPAAPSFGEFTTLANQYSRAMDRFQPQIAAIMRTIARAPVGGVLFHCMAGKDRTGQIAALLLDLAGVPRDVIGADYALSVECLRPWDEEWLANGPGERADREREYARHLPTAEVMCTMLAHLDRQYGGVEAYLLGAGVTEQDIAALRNRLLV